jgi:hypothetical protein
MNNKLVAWTNKDELAKYRPIIAEKEYSIHFPIPLYTHLVKEQLTDEEKWEVFTNLARSPDLRADMIRFADSILRKASEK